MAHGPRPPVRLALRLSETYSAWLRDLFAPIIEALVSSRHLKRGPDPRADARAHDPTGRVTIMVAQARAPVDAIGALGEDVAAANAADLARVGKVIGIRMSDVVPHDVIAEFRQTNVEKIKSIAEESLGEMTKLLGQAEDEGWHANALREAIEERFSVGESRAALLARDQVLKLNGEITQRRQVESGISRYIWTTSGDERVREMHDLLEGTEHAWANPPEVSEDGRREHPGGDYQCRCTAMPVLDFGEGDEG